MASVVGSPRASMMSIFRALREEEVAVICFGYVNKREVYARRTYGVDSRCGVDCVFAGQFLYALCSSLSVVHTTCHSFLHVAGSPPLAGWVPTQHSLLCHLPFLCTIYYSPPPAGWVCTWGHSPHCTPFIPARFLLSSTLLWGHT
jgi:hypothetical protein